MRKFSNKTILFSILVIILSLIIFDIYIWHHTESFLIEGIRKDMKKKLSLAKALVGDFQFDELDKNKMYQFAVEIKNMTSLRTTLIDKSGRVIADSEIPPDHLKDVENHLNRPEVQEAMRYGSGLARRTSATIHEKLFYYCEPVRENGRITGFIRLAMFSPEFNERMNFLIGLVVRSNIFFILVALFATYAYIKWFNAQLDKVRTPLETQRDKSDFKNLLRHRYEEFDRISKEINVLGQKFENSSRILGSEKEQLMAIFNSLNEGVAAFNKNGIALLHNLAFREILEVSADNKGTIRFYDWIQFPPLIEDIEEFLEKGKPIKKRTKFYGDRYIDYQISPLKMNDIPLAGFLLTLVDVTHLQQLETIRQDFVANVSHEFKTPLTSIRGYAETLLSGTIDNKKQREKFLQKIEKQTIHLENLVSDLLQLSRIEKRKTEDLVKLKPVPLIKKILSEFEPLAQEKNLVFHKEIPRFEEKIKIKANEQLLQTIIWNLLTNAMQYNKPDGQIWFRLMIKDHSLRLEVEDTGLGIPQSQQERIFERFYRVEVARYQFPEGSGLGLSIVRHSVDLLSGTAGLTSEEDKGSLFWVEIPLLKS
jgi:two-component system phosphate regulon sensor histidine kinase PhoR